VAQLAQTTATIQAQLAQVHSTMSGLATAVERQVQTTSIFQAQPPFNTPITPLVPAPEPPRIPLQVGSPGQLQQPNPPPLNQPAPAPEPPRIPLQAVPHSSPGYFDAMRPPTAPNGRSQQPNPRTPKGVPYGYSVMRF
jgi:hypothetical protein